MSGKESSFTVLVEDMTTSFKFAAKNAISFLLGMIGVLIVTALLIVVGLAVGALVLLGTLSGPEGMVRFFEQYFVEAFASSFNPAMGFGIGIGFLALLPLVAPFFVAIGALFGMSREIVESAGTTAEGVFTWYKSKFFALAGGGILAFLTIIGPFGLMWWAGFTFIPYDIWVGGGLPSILTAISFVWIILSTGMMLMVCPAIIDGESVIEAYKKSVRMSIDYFDRVFATLMGFFVLLLALLMIVLVPFGISIATGSLPGLMDPIMIVIMVALIPISIFIILLYIPAFAITVTRVYMILSGIEVVDEVAEEFPDVSMIGGM